MGPSEVVLRITPAQLAYLKRAVSSDLDHLESIHAAKDEILEEDVRFANACLAIIRKAEQLQVYVH